MDEENELYYFNARYYDAEVGRFISVDPAQDGWNWYAYANNNPLKFVDPTGLVTENVTVTNIITDSKMSADQYNTAWRDYYKKEMYNLGLQEKVFAGAELFFKEYIDGLGTIFDVGDLAGFDSISISGRINTLREINSTLLIPGSSMTLEKKSVVISEAESKVNTVNSNYYFVTIAMEDGKKTPRYQIDMSTYNALSCNSTETSSSVGVKKTTRDSGTLPWVKEEWKEW